MNKINKKINKIQKILGRGILVFLTSAIFIVPLYFVRNESIFIIIITTFILLLFVGWFVKNIQFRGTN